MSLTNPISETTLSTVQNNTSIESNKYVSVRRFWNGITKLFNTANNWIALQAFNSITTKQIYTTKQSFTPIGAGPSQAVNLDNGSYILLNLTGASGTVTLTLLNGRVGASYFIEVIQHLTTKVDVSFANQGRFDGETGSVIAGVVAKNYVIVPFFTGTSYLLNIAQLT